MTEKSKAVQVKLSFFAASSYRVYRLCLASFGLYSLYWFYQNWQAIHRSGAKVNPLLRGWILPMFFVFQLFEIIEQEISPSKTVKVFCRIAPIFFWAGIILPFVMPIKYFGLFLIAEAVCLFVISLSLSEIQEAINKYNSQKIKPVTFGEIAVVMFIPLMFLIVAFSVYVNGKKAATSLSERYMATVTFKHLYAYPRICEQNGYIITQYPREFINYFTPELLQYNRYLTARGIDESIAWQQLPNAIVDELMNEALKDLESIRQTLVKKTEDASIADACQRLDNQGATDMLQSIESSVKFYSGKL